MKTVFALIALSMLAVNVSFAADLGEGSAPCKSMVQANRNASAAVVATESADVEASESTAR